MNEHPYRIPSRACYRVCVLDWRARAVHYERTTPNGSGSAPRFTQTNLLAKSAKCGTNYE